MPNTQTTLDKYKRAALAKRRSARDILMPLAISSWWVPGQDLKEYTSEFQKDEAWRLEHIAAKLAEGKLNTPGQKMRLAHRIGCTSKFILRVMMNKTMMDVVKERIKARAVYGAAEALTHQVEVAKRDPAAFKTLLQTGKVLEVGGGGAKVEINTTIDRRNGGDNESAVQFIEAFRKRSRQGFHRNVALAEVVTPEKVNEEEVP